MIIEKIHLYHISQRLVSPFVTSFGMEEDRHCLLLSIQSADLEGWGECAASYFPGYSYETVATAWHVLADFLIPSVLGQDIEKPEDIEDALDEVRGHPLAKASLDSAVWDLVAQRQGISLSQALAKEKKHPVRERVEVGVSVGIQPSIDETLSVIESYRQKGYRRIKLKIRPGLDVTLAQTVRSAFPSIPLMLDANSAYSLEDAPIFQQMDDLGLLMIEQPFDVDDLFDHSLLQRQINTPLCLDESIHTLYHARQAIQMRACDIINIKPGRVGGLTQALRIHDLCYTEGMPVWCGGMLETGVGRAAQLALASLPGYILPGDISATERYYEEDIALPHFELNPEDSTITVPSQSGLGIEVDRNRLQKVTLRSEEFLP